MIRIVWEQGFKKGLIRRKSRAIMSLRNDFGVVWNYSPRTPLVPPKDPQAYGRTRRTVGFSVAFDCRVIFEFVNEDEVLLVDIGSHEEVY